jgi:hypothetical protein
LTIEIGRKKPKGESCASAWISKNKWERTYGKVNSWVQGNVWNTIKSQGWCKGCSSSKKCIRTEAWSTEDLENVTLKISSVFTSTNQFSRN